MADNQILKAPFPWPGGKARVADRVWAKLGNCDNYCEPFAGSLAVLLRRPADHFAGGYRVETVNDKDHYVSNFWRAVTHAPDEVAGWADWPVTEVDLHARHKWLVRSEFAADWRGRMAEDPDHYDAKVAGWWCWGLCCWIGSGWCSEDTPAAVKRPVITDPSPFGRGCNQSHGRPQLADAFDIGRGVNGGGHLSRQVPLISGPGDGVNAVARTREEPAGQIRDLSGGFGNGTGVHNRSLSQQMPTLMQRGGIGWGVHSEGVHGTCDARRAWLVAWMRRLADRLRLVRTCYGEWDRICDSDSTMTRLGTTGVFLDPPYPVRSTNGKKSRADGLYANDKAQDLDKLRDGVLAWCRKWGPNPQVRIAVCGYEGDGYEQLVAEGWTEEKWSASGGYGNQGKGKKKSENADRERIWYSPACVADDLGLFAGVADG